MEGYERITQNKVTSIQELLSYKNGEIVKLPAFAEGQEFYARLKRPSMLALAKTGKIPNELLYSANSLFNNTTERLANVDENMMSHIYDVLDVLCEAAFVEPTWKELKDNGIELSDDQILFIFSYSQMGVKSLESFRK